MTTSAEQITNLISLNTGLKDYFEQWRGYYEGRFNDFEADVHAATSSTVYVDQVNGSDNNAGTLIAPFMTIEKAVTKMSWGGYCTIRLIGDYHLERQVFVRAGALRIESEDPANKSQLSVGALATNVAGSVAQFYLIGMCYLHFVNLEIEIGLADVSATQKAVIVVDAASCLNVASSVISVVPGAGQFLLSGGVGKTIKVVATTFPAEMAGRWVVGVAAATDPMTLRDVSSCNLATL